MRTKQIAFVPQWIDTVMKRNALGGDDLLKIERLAPFFSIEDLASLIALGHRSIFFTAISVTDDSLSWDDRWYDSTKDVRLQKLVNDAAMLASQGQFQNEILNRLFATQSSVAGEEQKETFEVSLLGDEGVKVLLLTGYSREQHIANASKLFRCIVKQLYVYEEYHQLMSRPVGMAYIESLLQ